MIPVLAVVAVLAVATACGAALSRAVAGDLSRGERAAWAVALGLLALAAACAALMALHVVPGPKKLAIVAAVVLGIAALERRRSGPPTRRPRITPAALLLGLGALAAAGVCAFAAVRTGLYGADALATWGVKARTIFEEARIPARLFTDPALATSHPEYPILVPLTLASVALGARGWNPHALALVSAAWQLATLAAVAGVLSRRTSRTAGAAGALLAALCAPLWLPTSVGTAEAPLALAIVLAGTAFLDWLDRPSGSALARLAVAGVMCAGTNPEGIAFCAILTACLVLRRGVRFRGAAAAALLVPAVASFWLSRALSGGAAHADFDASLLRPSHWAQLLPRLRDVAVHLLGAEIPDAWPLVAGIALVLLVGSASFADALILPLILQCASYAVAAAASAYDPIWHLVASFSRTAAALWPAAVLVLVGRASASLRVSRAVPRRTLVPALAGAALALALLLPAVAGARLRASGPVTIAGLARPTFHATVEPILQARCQSCHHEGGIAPIPLVHYRDADEHAAAVARMVDSRRMPPWKAAAGPHAFANDPTLTWGEREAIVRWARRGAPEGRPSDAPAPRTFPAGWDLGAPDLVLKAPRFSPDFSKGDVYQCFVLPTNLEDDSWVSAVEVRPGNPKMMHHALLYVEEGATSLKLDDEAPGPGYPCFGGPRALVTDSFGEWAPGMQPRRYPPGVARFLPRESRIVMQVHYSALSGDVKPDESEVGVYFAKEPVTRRLLSDDVRSYAPFTLAAGDPVARLHGSYGPLPSRAELVAILPHMHLLGRTMTVTARLPGGEREKLVDVNDWDLRWQRTYFFEKPVVLPAGTVLELAASFDNSLANPKNPTDPPKDVHFGEMTTDEMCMALLFWTVDGRNPGEKNAFFRNEVCAPGERPVKK